MKQMLQTAALGLAAWLGLSHTALSDTWMDRFQAERAYYNEVTDRACAGDRAALEELGTAAWDDVNAVALNNIAWLHRPTTSCVGVSFNVYTYVDGYQFSAQEGYPIGMHNWGRVQLIGEHVPQDTEAGMIWLEEASTLGFAGSAEELAMILAEGRHGVSQDIRLADLYYNRAAELGLSQDRLTALGTLIDRAAGNGVPPAPTLPTPPDPAPTPGGYGGDIYLVYYNGHQGDVPQLGDRIFIGNGARQIVYIAQGFGRVPDGAGCFIAEAVYITGWAIVDRNEYTQSTIDGFFEASDSARAQGNHRGVSAFRSLEEGIDYVHSNFWRVDQMQQPYMWSAVEARAFGPQCPSNISEYPIHYPAPVFGPE